MRTLSLAALGAAAVLGSGAVVHTADAARSHTSHASHGSTHHAGATTASSNGGAGTSATSPGLAAGNGLLGCSTVDNLPVVGQLPIPSIPDPTATVLHLLPDPAGLLSSGLNFPIANMSPSSIVGIVVSSACP
ncbi:MAG TPA: hypothetical protein VGL20_11305 [Candidatus Dormibacteraeota bacterium]|jgi:hypothetical protein